MGLFNKNSRQSSQDDFSSTNETIDLSAAIANKTDSPTQEDEGVPDDKDDLESGGGIEHKPHYGIEDAISLMRALPSDSVELVVQVVKQTLLSAKIDVGEILVEAKSRKNRITSDIDMLVEEITFFDTEISDRKKQIAQLRTDHEETSLVEERLQLAISLDKRESEKSKSKSKTIFGDKGKTEVYKKVDNDATTISDKSKFSDKSNK